MTNIDASGKISTGGSNQAQQQGLTSGVGQQGLQAYKPTAASVSKVTHVIAAVLASVAAFALTPAGQALIAQYPHLAVVSGLVATLASLYKAPSAD
jgi:hypothetical protein